MSNIKFNGIFGGEHTTARIEDNENGGVEIFINGILSVAEM